MVGEWAEREAERMSRPLGDQREITEADLWKRGRRRTWRRSPTSRSASTWSTSCSREDWTRPMTASSAQTCASSASRPKGRDHGAEFADWQRDRAIRRVLEPRIEAWDLAIRRNGEAIEGFRTAVADSLRELGRRMEQALRMLEQQVRRTRQARPAPQPPGPVATPDQPRPEVPAPPASAVQPSGGFRM